MNKTGNFIDDRELRAQFVVGALASLKSRYTRKELWTRFQDQIYRDCATRLNIELFPKQAEVVHSRHKTRVIRSARRTSKSFTSAFISYSLLFFSSMFNEPLHIKYAAPRAEDTRNVWEHLYTFLDRAPIDSMNITYDNRHNKSTNKKEMKFENGSWIKSATCDAPEMNDIRGDAHDLIIVDEFGQIKYKNSFLEAALYSLKDKDPLNMLMIVGTYDVVGNGEEFDHLFELGQEARDDIKSFTLKGSDNPYSDQEAAMSAKDIVTEEGYLREELGEGVPQFGRMFKDFNMKTQVKDLQFDPDKELIVGVDFGFRKPIILFGQFKGITLYVLHEISPKDIRIDLLVQEMKAVLVGKFDNKTPMLIGCDPAGDKVNDVVSYNSFNKLQEAFPMATYTRNPQLVSKANQVILLKALTMKDNIFVDSSCNKLIRAFAMAQPDVTRAGAINSAGWLKEKGHDDPLDALSYALINYGPTSQMIIPEQEKQKAPSSFDVQRALSRF